MSAEDLKALAAAGVLRPLATKGEEHVHVYERHPLPMRVELDLVDMLALDVEFTITTNHDGGDATYRIVSVADGVAAFDLVRFDQGGSKP